MIDQALVEDRVLEMRSAGRSFGAIAKLLGFATARDAYDAFQSALWRRPPVERAELGGQELQRLDELAKRLRARPVLSEGELARKLAVLDGLRARLAVV